MRKLSYILALALPGLATAPAAAAEGWSAFLPASRGYDRPYVIFVPGEYGRSGRFVSWDDGYFMRGGGVQAGRTHATFDYDRDYPYDYPSYSLAVEDDEEPLREPSCTMERVRDGQGWSDVRICRN